MDGKHLLSQSTGHIGRIFFNLTIFAFVCCACLVAVPLLWTLLVILYFMMIVIVIGFTFGIAFLDESVRKFFGDIKDFLFADKMAGIMDFIANNISKFFIGTAILFLLAFVFLLFDRKTTSSKNRLIALTIMLTMFLGVVVAVLAFNVGGFY